MSIKMIHHRQRLTLSLEASDDLSGVVLLALSGLSLEDAKKNASEQGAATGQLCHCSRQAAVHEHRLAIESLATPRISRQGDNDRERESSILKGIYGVASN